MSRMNDARLISCVHCGSLVIINEALSCLFYLIIVDISSVSPLDFSEDPRQHCEHYCEQGF